MMSDELGGMPTAPDMGRRTEARLRLLGWVAIFLGILPLSIAILNLIILQNPNTPVGTGGPAHPLSEDRSAQLGFALRAAVGFPRAALLAGTGIGLLLRQAWARVAAFILTLVCGIPLALCITWWAVLLLPAVILMQEGGAPLRFLAPVVQCAVLIVVVGGQAWLLVLFILWLLSDEVIAACHGGAPPFFRCGGRNFP